MHPYDIGDAVAIDHKELIVLGIDLFSTTFQKVNGDILYIQNQNFGGKSIVNHARAEVQTSRVSLVVNSADFNRIFELKSLLKRSDAKIIVSDFVNGPDVVKICLSAQFKCVLTDEARIKRQAEFSRSVEDGAKNLKIEYKVI